MEPWTVRWEETRIAGKGIDQWFAYLPSRNNACFAGIGRVINSTLWTCDLFPRGRNPGNPWMFIRAPTLEKGKLWVERWAVYHWEAVAMGVPPEVRRY